MITLVFYDAKHNLAVRRATDIRIDDEKNALLIDGEPAWFRLETDIGDVFCSIVEAIERGDRLLEIDY